MKNRTQKKMSIDRKRLKKSLRNLGEAPHSSIYPESTIIQEARVHEILNGDIVRKRICHIWYNNGTRQLYEGKVKNVSEISGLYNITYWIDEEDNEDIYKLTKYELAVDYLLDDFIIK